MNIDSEKVVQCTAKIEPFKRVFVHVDFANGSHCAFDFEFFLLDMKTTLVTVSHCGLKDEFVIDDDQFDYLGYSVVFSLTHCYSSDVINVQANYHVIEEDDDA